MRAFESGPTDFAVAVYQGQMLGGRNRCGTRRGDEEGCGRDGLAGEERVHRTLIRSS